MTGFRRLLALRNARRRQLVARALRPVNRRRTRSSPLPRGLRPVEGPVDLWRSAAFSTTDNVAERLPDGELKLLGRSVTYPPDGWRGERLERLRRFHLHYGEEILGAARDGGRSNLDAARAGLAAWIESNPPAAGDGWHPYTLSTRVGNWIAATSLEPSLATDSVAESLWRQLSYLEHNVEDELLGNHVLRNARALVLGGVAFSEARLVARGVTLLQRELPEQVLPDGGHYERSPVYHALVLRDLLEIRSAAGLGELDPVIDRMKTFAAALSRPDGRPALFNDGGLELAPDLSALLPEAEPGLVLFRDTGYATVRRDSSLWLAFDCGPAAPDFLPPHAHADGLSFQLWLGGKPLIVDPGTLTYEPGHERDWHRGTRAHSTVAVDGLDQFELWGAFRASGIPAVDIVEIAGSEHEGVLEAELSAFGRVGTRVRHRRRLSWSADAISIEDRLEGRGRRFVESALPFAPSTQLEAGLPLRADGVVIEPVGDLGCAIEERPVSERFFEQRPAPALVMRGELQLPASFGWILRLPSGS